jgi:hypothetical protein
MFFSSIPFEPPLARIRPRTPCFFCSHATVENITQHLDVGNLEVGNLVSRIYQLGHVSRPVNVSKIMPTENVRPTTFRGLNIWPSLSPKKAQIRFICMV